MKTTFNEIPIGTKFKLQNSEFIKTQNSDINSHKPLSKRKPNSINLNSQHNVIIGSKVIVTTLGD